MMPPMCHHNAITMMALRQQTDRGRWENLTFRKATPADVDRIAEIINGEPGQATSQVTIGLVGDPDLAQAWGKAQIQMPHSPVGWEHSVVGELDGQVVVVLQAGDESEFSITPAVVVAGLRAALRIFGVLGVLRRQRQLRAEELVRIGPPEDSYYIAGLDVDPRHRNRGIGGAALDYAEAEARRLGHRQMSLSTTTINPARHLYERHGFRVVETRTDETYERYTGIPGRHLMVKELA